ncbi:MAG: hypothetical protein M1518_00765 [Candidatus Thermoplasmatota archaeon]|nr:hypothetical protein [Candidatus Thermoplasmatota archaeon]
MRNILDDEFVLQMEESPPFSWIKQSPDRFMNCKLNRRIDSLIVNATGNSFVIAEMVKDILGPERVRVEKTFSLSEREPNCIITYSGEFRDAINALERAENKGIIISSGGIIKNLARKKGWDYIPLPKGYPTRFLFPEIFGCLLSLLGNRPDFSKLGDHLESNAPSQITVKNEAKQLALALAKEPISIIYDQRSEGLARGFNKIFQSNSGIEFDLVDVSDPKDSMNSELGKNSVISFAKDDETHVGWNVGNFPYPCDSLVDYVKNVLTGQLASLYLGISHSIAIELLDRELE